MGFPEPPDRIRSENQLPRPRYRTGTNCTPSAITWPSVPSLEIVVVSDDAEKVTVDKGAHVIPWNDAFASLNKLRDYIATFSDHMPVVSRFYFTDTRGD